MRAYRHRSRSVRKPISRRVISGTNAVSKLSTGATLREIAPNTEDRVSGAIAVFVCSTVVDSLNLFLGNFFFYYYLPYLI